MKKLELQEKSGILGSYVIRQYKKGTKELLWESPLIKNLVVVSDGYGKNIVLRQLGGDTTYPIEIDSLKIGTGTNAPAASDTDLQTPVLSGVIVADVNIAVSSMTLSFFIPDGDLANNTYTEVGIYCNGRLFARSLISPVYIKTSNVDTSIDYTITIT